VICLSQSFHYHATLRHYLKLYSNAFTAVPEPPGSKFAYRFYFPEMEVEPGRGGGGGKGQKGIPIRDYRVAEYREWIERGMRNKANNRESGGD
jgi:hypothetical protein